jgi:hypothetical protein
MQYILTEEQHQLILTEGFKDAVEGRLKRAYDFTKDTIQKAGQQYSLSFRFLLTYGAGIGSIMPAITDYLNGQYPNLSESEVAGVALSAISLVFFNAKDYVKIYKKMKEDGQIEELKSAVSFTEKLKDRVARILDVLGMSLYQGLDIISYSFLLPILPALLEMLQNPEMDMIALKGMLNSSYITASAIVIQKIIEKLSGKIASKKTSDGVSDEMDLDPTPESDIV